MVVRFARSFLHVAGAMLLLAAMHGCAPGRDHSLREIDPPDSAQAPPDGEAPSASTPPEAQPAPQSSRGSGKAPAWPFWPAHMRLHPLTRLAGDLATGEQIIECRIEFEDPDHQTCRAVGQLSLQLYPDAFVPSGANAALQTWNQDLRDLELNRRQYDDVTRTYLFRLQLTQPPPAGSELRAFFLSADGKRMNAQIRLRQ